MNTWSRRKQSLLSHLSISFGTSSRRTLVRFPVQGKRLHLYVDATGRDGVEFPTAVGPIDILANDDSGAFYVFELKRARTPDHAVGQLSRYMGWVKHTIGKDREVHGVIVAKTIPESLHYAVFIIPNLSLFEYEVSFKLTLAHGFPLTALNGLGGRSQPAEAEEI
jgi:endonuclease